MPNVYKGITLPSDGDVITAASVNVPFTALINNALNVIAAGSVTIPTGLLLNLWSFTGSYVELLSSGLPNQLASIASLLPGDIVDMFCTTSMNIAAGLVVSGKIRLEYTENGATSTSAVANGEATIVPPGTTNTYPMAVSGMRVVGTGGTFNIYLNGCVGTANGTTNFQPVEGNLNYRVWRANQ
jgi:hypothetical protein